jgi:hypothetical protein
MQTAFRLDKRSGESHKALDGKKNVFSRAENEIAAVTFIVWNCLTVPLLLSQAFAAWRGWGADSVWFLPLIGLCAGPVSVLILQPTFCEDG